jgi:hypothetical protein
MVMFLQGRRSTRTHSIHSGEKALDGLRPVFFGQGERPLLYLKVYRPRRGELGGGLPGQAF